MSNYELIIVEMIIKVSKRLLQPLKLKLKKKYYPDQIEKCKKA